MNSENVITSITIDGVTFECNIQTDGTWSVYLPFIEYDEVDGVIQPVNINVADLNKIDDAYYPIYEPDGTVTNPQEDPITVLENKYTFYWPISSEYNVLHFWDAENSSYEDRAAIHGIAKGIYYKMDLPYDPIGICLCKDEKSSTHMGNWVFDTPGEYYYNVTEHSWSTADGSIVVPILSGGSKKPGQ